jgi:electron transfer flavoprotein beta subunit
VGALSDPLKGYVLRTGPGRLNPPDAAALELALRLKDEFGARVDLFSMGPSQAEEVLREALSLGADRAFHLCDPLLAGSDSLATARALVRALDLEGPHDLILCGPVTTDGGTGQVGPAMAALMDFPFLGRVWELLSLEDRLLRVRQLYRDELLETKLTLPCVISVLGEKFVPRLPSVRARLRPRLVNRLTLEDLTREAPKKGPGPKGPSPKGPNLKGAKLPGPADYFGESGSPTKILKSHKPKGPDKVLARPTPAAAAQVIIDAAKKAKT